MSASNFASPRLSSCFWQAGTLLFLTLAGASPAQAQYAAAANAEQATGRWLDGFTNDVRVGGNGFNVPPSRLRVVNGVLYAGGGFTDIRGDPDADFLVQWTGTRWARAVARPPNAVLDMVEYKGNLYVASTSPTRRSALARWDGYRWEELPVMGTVRALAVHEDTLHIGGVFDSPGALTRHLVRYDGASFRGDVRLTSAQGAITGFAVLNTRLYAVGTIPAGPSSIGTSGFYEYQTGRWSSINLDPFGLDGDDRFQVLVSRPDDLYLGGSFVGRGVAFLARWSGTALLPVPYPAVRSPTTLAEGARGVFLGAGAYTGYWDGSRWRAFGNGVDGTVTQMVVLGDQVFVGGDFTSSGDGEVAMRNIGVFEFSPTVEVESGDGVEVAHLSPVSPNPVRGGRAQSRLRLGAPERIEVYVADVLGRRAQSLYSGMASGDMPLEVNSDRLAPGVYVLRVEGDRTRLSRPFVVTR